MGTDHHTGTWSSGKDLIIYTDRPALGKWEGGAKGIGKKLAEDEVEWIHNDPQQKKNWRNIDGKKPCNIKGHHCRTCAWDSKAAGCIGSSLSFPKINLAWH